MWDLTTALDLASKGEPGKFNYFKLILYCELLK